MILQLMMLACVHDARQSDLVSPSTASSTGRDSVPAIAARPEDARMAETNSLRDQEGVGERSASVPPTLTADWCIRESILWSPPVPWALANETDFGPEFAELQAIIINIWQDRAFPIDCRIIRADFDGDGSDDLAAYAVDRTRQTGSLWVVRTTGKVSEAKLVIDFPGGSPSNAAILSNPMYLKEAGNNPSGEYRSTRTPEPLIRNNAIAVCTKRQGANGDPIEVPSDPCPCTTYVYHDGVEYRKFKSCGD